MILLPRGSNRRQCCSWKLETSLAIPEGSEPPGATAEKILKRNDRQMHADGFLTTMLPTKRPLEKWATSHIFHQFLSHKHLQSWKGHFWRRTSKTTKANPPNPTHDKLQYHNIRYSPTAIRCLLSWSNLSFSNNISRLVFNGDNYVGSHSRNPTSFRKLTPSWHGYDGEPCP
jgi:hypothetical protein